MQSPCWISTEFRVSMSQPWKYLTISLANIFQGNLPLLWVSWEIILKNLGQQDFHWVKQTYRKGFGGKSSCLALRGGKSSGLPWVWLCLPGPVILFHFFTSCFWILSSLVAQTSLGWTALAWSCLCDGVWLGPCCLEEAAAGLSVPTGQAPSWALSRASGRAAWVGTVAMGLVALLLSPVPATSPLL